MNTENLRISFFDMYIRKQTHPGYSNRIDKEEVKRLYQQREAYKISLNDQLEIFYNKCKINRFLKHEVTYFFHAEYLYENELKQYQTKFHKNLIRKQNDNSKGRFSLVCSLQKYIGIEKKLDKSKRSDYRLYGGVRATIIFYPRWGLPNNEELSSLCEEIRPMMYTQLWRKWDPINKPVSTKQIEVIGFKKHTLLEDEDFDTAFPSIGKSGFDHQNMTFASYRPLTSSFLPLSSDFSASDRQIPDRAGQNSHNTAKITYAAISRS